MIIMDRSLCPRTVRSNKDLCMPRGSHRINRGKGRALSHSKLIDRRAQHNRLSLQAGMTDADNNMAVYTGK